jgi:tetratricopeptide (TPR) repeat protein
MIPFDTPKTYDNWLAQKRLENISQESIIKLLMSDGRSIAILNAARISSLIGDNDKWFELARIASQSDSSVIREAALVELAIHEFNFSSKKSSVLSDALIPSLFVCLENLNKTLPYDEWISETELRIFIFIADCYVESQQYEMAKKYASLAIITAKKLLLDSYKINAYNIMALINLRLEKLSDAFEGYAIIARNSNSSDFLQGLARVNQAVIVSLLGDDNGALDILEKFLEIQPEHFPAIVSHQYIKGILGWLSDDELIIEDTSNNFSTQTHCFRLLLSNQGNPKEAALNEILSVMRSWSPNSSIAALMAKWFQAFTLYKLGQSLLSIKIVDSIESHIPSVNILIDALKLELALLFDAVEFESVEKISFRITQIFLDSKDPQERSGLAARLAFWYPTAAAFLAFSPFSTLELHEFGAGSVFKDGRPITIYGQGIPARLPFVQKTLSVFGFNTQVERDQSVENSRLAKILLVKRGSRQHYLPIVPPALIVYQFIRVSEYSGLIWKRAASSLVRSHGLVPTTSGGFLRMERRCVQELLEKLVEGTINAETFKKSIQNLY